MPGKQPYLHVYPPFCWGGGFRTVGMNGKHGCVYVAPPPCRGGGCGDNNHALRYDNHLLGGWLQDCVVILEGVWLDDRMYTVYTMYGHNDDATRKPPVTAAVCQPGESHV
jgi:hypothetical protein